MLLKVEGANPTGSFKDRGMTVAMSKAARRGREGRRVRVDRQHVGVGRGLRRRAPGLLAAVIIPDGHVALGKLAQALIHGAKVVQIRGSFDDALHLVRELGERGGVTVVNSINPFRIEGQKTAAFEICDALGDAPDVHCIPVGNAGNITAYWKGYGEYVSRRHSRRSSRACSGWQAAGFGAARARRAGRCIPRRSRPRSGSATRRRGTPAIAARDESGGAIDAVTDAQILDAYKLLAATEGVFVEPASAASVAGLLQARRGRAGRTRRDGRVHGDRPRPEGSEPRDRADRAAAGRRRRSSTRCWRSSACEASGGGSLLGRRTRAR